MPTTTEILSLAPGASYLAANEIRKGSLFPKNKTSPILNQQIYAVYFILNKIYTRDPTYAGLDACAQYLWELMGRWGVKAQGLSGGGGSVTPITPITIPSPVWFTVDSNSFLPTGTSSTTITSFIGFELQFIRGGIPQSTLTSESSYYTWSKTTGIFTCSPALLETELIGLIPY